MPGDGHRVARGSEGVNMGWYRSAVYMFGALFVVIGLALLVVTAANGGGVLGFVMGALFVALGVARVRTGAEAPLMARKVRGFERVLDAPALFAIAYGEIGASIYVALGIVAAAALGLTPLVLLLTGAVFLLVALSYAEGTAAIPETGGADRSRDGRSTIFVGFVTGWALFLDYLIVVDSLSALFLPHFVGAGLRHGCSTRHRRRTWW